MSDRLSAKAFGANNTILLSGISVLNDLNRAMTFTISESNQFELLLAEGTTMAYSYNILNNNNINACSCSRTYHYAA